jgi:hypothetical protein
MRWNLRSFDGFHGFDGLALSLLKQHRGYMLEADHRRFQTDGD